MKFRLLSESIAFQCRKIDIRISMMLLDKIKDTKAVLRLMITSYEERQKPEYFCSPNIDGLPKAYHVETRPVEEFNKMIEEMRKNKVESSEFKTLFETVMSLDAVY